VGEEADAAELRASNQDWRRWGRRMDSRAPPCACACVFLCALSSSCVCSSTTESF
jgi:hypothetical protein